MTRVCDPRFVANVSLFHYRGDGEKRQRVTDNVDG